MTDVVGTYRQRFDSYLQRVASALEDLVRSHLDTTPLIDRVTARAKDPERFAAKAAKRADDGTPKYEHPLTEIQDQLGVRVVVFYPAVVAVVSDVVHTYFRSIENLDLVPDSPWEFGYIGKHHILALPPDVVPSDVKLDDAPSFFELQIKTLFQHAWSEAEHDLGYKPAGELTNEHQRLLAFAAAQAWGADRAFDQLHCALKREDG